jgi:hypothetical protein
MGNGKAIEGTVSSTMIATRVSLEDGAQQSGTFELDWILGFSEALMMALQYPKRLWPSGHECFLGH